MPPSSLNMTLRKVTTNQRIFPSDEAVFKVIYLVMRNISKKWTMPIREGLEASTQPLCRGVCRPVPQMTKKLPTQKD